MLIDLSQPQWGVKGDGVTDDAPAINAAIAYMRANAGTVDPGDPYGTRFEGFFLAGPPGAICLVNSPIDATMLTEQLGGNGGDFRGVVMDWRGCRILSGPGFPAGAAMLDLMGSRWLKVRDLVTIGAPGPNAPGVGIQIGHASEASADMITIEDWTAIGSYSFAAFYNLASEMLSLVRARLMNAASGAYQMIGDGTAAFVGRIRTAAPESVVAGTPESFNDCVYDQCSFWQGGLDATGQVPVYLGKASGHEFRSCYAVKLDAAGAEGPYLEAIGCDNLVAKLRCENGKGYSAYWSGPGAIKRQNPYPNPIPWEGSLAATCALALTGYDWGGLPLQISVPHDLTEAVVFNGPPLAGGAGAYGAVPNDLTLELYLNGHTITSPNAAAPLTISADARVTVQGGTCATAPGGAAAIFVQNDGFLGIGQGMTLKVDGATAALHVEMDGVVEMFGPRNILKLVGASGTGFQIDGGKLEIDPSVGNGLDTTGWRLTDPAAYGAALFQVLDGGLAYAIHLDWSKAPGNGQPLWFVQGGGSTLRGTADALAAGWVPGPPPTFGGIADEY